MHHFRHVFNDTQFVLVMTLTFFVNLFLFQQSAHWGLNFLNIVPFICNVIFQNLNSSMVIGDWQSFVKLEDANYYGLRTIMNMGKSTDYELILRMADMNTLEHRRIEQSLMIFFKCFKENGPGYVANLFKPRVTPYNLRSNGLNVVQTSYNSRFLHGSYAYMISHIWNQLPSAVKNAPNASSFRRLLTKLNFIDCQCSNCLWPDLFLSMDVTFFFKVNWLLLRY